MPEVCARFPKAIWYSCEYTNDENFYIRMTFTVDNIFILFKKVLLVMMFLKYIK
jgi:hypothetical protein